MKHIFWGLILLILNSAVYAKFIEKDQFIEKNGVVYWEVPSPVNIPNGSNERDFSAAVKHYGSDCLRNGSPVSAVRASIVLSHQRLGVWEGWHCPDRNSKPDDSHKPDPGSESDSSNGSNAINYSGGGDSSDNNSNSTPTLPKAPDLPAPTIPKNLSPDLIAGFGRQIEEVRNVYQKILKSLEQRAKEAEINYANNVIFCEKKYPGYGLHIDRKNCNDSVLEQFEREIKRILEAIDGTVQAYNEAINNIKAAIAKDAGVKPEELPAAPDLNKPIPSLCKIGDSWSFCVVPAANPSDSGSQAGTDGGNSSSNNGGATNNTTNNITNSNSTTNNNSSNSSTTNNTTNVQGKDYSGILGGIQKTLDDIATKLANINSSGSGKGDKGQSDGKDGGSESGDKEGNQISEYCKEHPQSLQCTNIGTAEEINRAIAAGKGKDHGFGISRHDGILPGFGRTSDFIESGSCPPPKTATVLGTRQEFTYQPLCDAAVKIRPFVIFCAIFLAAIMARYAIMAG